MLAAYIFKMLVFSSSSLFFILIFFELFSEKTKSTELLQAELSIDKRVKRATYIVQLHVHVEKKRCTNAKDMTSIQIRCKQNADN
jgi:hypothetical protein